MKEKVITDSKRLAYPKWKTTFDILFLLGVLFLVCKLIVIVLNKFIGTEIIILEGIPKVILNFLPLVLMVTGGIGSDRLKNKFIE